MARARIYFLFALAIFFLAPQGQAVVKVGDKPKYKFTDLNTGEEITSDEMRGKAVMLIFWNPSDRDSMMILQTYGMASAINSPIVAIAVTVDRPRRERNIKRALNQIGFTGRVVYDNEKGGMETASSWGVHDLPAIFAIIPNGQVVAAVQGKEVMQPSSMVELTLNYYTALEKHPPIQEGEHEQGLEKLNNAEAEINAGNYDAALAALDGLNPMLADYYSDIREKYNVIASKLDPRGENELNKVRLLIKQGNYEKAIPQLVALSGKYSALPIGKIIKGEILRVKHNSTVARKEAEREYEKRVARMLSQAAELISSGRRLDARRKLKLIVKRFPDAKTTKTAKTILDALERDPGFKQEQEAFRIRTTCEKLLNEADELISKGDKQGAIERWSEIIKRFPESEYAKQAQKKLQDN